MENHRRRTLIIGLFVALIIALVFTLLILLFSGSETNTTISTSPRKSTIKIDGKEYNIESTKQIFLEPGTYTVIASASGFVDQTSTIIVTDVSSENEFGILLDPETQDAKDLIRSENESEWRDIVGQLEAKNFSETLFTQYPLFSFLPKIGSYYRVDYSLNPEGNNDENTYIVWITADGPAQENEARQWVESVDSVGTYDIRIRKYAESPNQSVQSAQGWEAVGRDISDPSIVR